MKAIFGVAAFLVLAGNALAGGPWRFTYDGKPMHWDASRPIVLNPDRGRLGKYSNADAINRLLVPAMTRWASVPTAHVRFEIGAALPRDVQDIYDADWAVGSGYNAIMFDTDGTILTQLGYPPQAVLAVTNFTPAPFEIIHQGYIIVNGCFVDGDPSNGEATETEMVSTLTHEIGHLLNLHHSQVNGHMFNGDTDDPAYRLFGPPPGDSVEVMYPLADHAYGTRWLTRDDEAALSRLYPAADATASRGSVSGTVRRADQYTRFQGADVVARNLDSPFYDAVSAISGQRYKGYVGGSVDFQLEGLYEIGGLTAGARYAVELVSLLAVSSNYGSSIGPLYPQVRLPGIDEFYNGANEAASNPPDDPLQYTEVRPEAGKTVENIDFVCTRVLPAGTVPTPVAYGTTKEGVIGRTGETDLYSFEGKKWEYVRIAATRQQCCVEPAIEAYAPDGKFLAATSGYSDLRLLLVADGTYTVAITDLDMKQTGSYTLTVEKLRDAPTPGEVSFGHLLKGDLKAEWQVDLYAFQGEAGDRVLAYAAGDDWRMHVEVELLDTRGVLLDQSSEVDFKLVDARLPAAGTYLLAVRDPYGWSTGPYALHLQRMNKPVNPIPVPYGVTQTGNVSVRGELVTYTFSGNAGDHVLLRVGKVAESQLSPIAYVFDPDGVSLYDSTEGWIRNLPVVLSKTGEYAVVCFGYYQGEFGFSVQRLNDPGNAVPMEFGVNRTVALSKAAETATFAWTAEAGDTVLLSFGNVPADYHDHHVELYDRDGLLVSEAPLYVKPLRWKADLDKGGRYTLLVYDEDTRTSSYKLYVQLLGNPGHVTEVPFGTACSASIESSGATANLGWTGNAGDAVLVNAVPLPSGPPYLDVEIYDPDGLRVARSYINTASFNGGLILPRTGRYLALVSDSSGATGSFALSVQRSPAPGNAVPLAFGETIRDSLTQPGGIRSYILPGQADTLVVISVTPESTAASKVYVSVSGPDGSGGSATILSNWKDGTATMQFSRSGPYVLSVGDVGGSGIGNYTVTASCRGCEPAPAAPVSELHFPFFDPAAAGYQGFAVCDLAPEPSTLHFTAYDNAGSVLAQKDKVLVPGSQVAFLPHELFGDVLAGRSGHVTVTSGAPGQKGFYLMFNAETTFLDGSGSLERGGFSSVLTESAASSAAGEISLQNVSGIQRSPQLELVGGDGVVREKAEITIPAHGSRTGRLDQLFTTGKVETDCFIRCRFCYGVDAFEMLRQGDSLAVHQAIDRGTARLYAPQVAMGGGYFTKLSLVDGGSYRKQVTITLFDEQGRTHREAAANPITVTVPGGGKLVVDVAEAFGIADDGRVQTGWLRLEWDSYGSIVGSVNMGDAGRGSATLLPLTGVGMTEAVIPHVAQNGTYFTGIAMLNFTTRAAEVSMKVYTAAGALAGQGSVKLGAGERVSKLLRELVPAVKDQTGGYVRISSDQDLIIYSLFGTNSLSVLSAIPASGAKGSKNLEGR